MAKAMAGSGHFPAKWRQTLLEPFGTGGIRWLPGQNLGPVVANAADRYAYDASF